MHEPLPKNNLKAFTFIEVLVAISIMAILFFVGIANFRGAVRVKSMDAVTNQVIADLRKAQQYAQGSKKPAGCNGDLEFVSLGKVNDTSYEIYATCTDTSKVNLQGPVTIPSNYEINFDPADPVQFRPVGRGVEDAIEITITNNMTGDESIINISDGGDIQ